jgi:hypothetical protein
MAADMTAPRIRNIRAAHRRWLKKVTPKKPRGRQPKPETSDAFQAFSKQFETDLVNSHTPSDKDVIGEVLSNG